MIGEYTGGKIASWRELERESGRGDGANAPTWAIILFLMR